eukprot:scaffold4254_cov60-Phaeocystis_antarctica.AAC.4
MASPVYSCEPGCPALRQGPSAAECPNKYLSNEGWARKSAVPSSLPAERSGSLLPCRIPVGYPPRCSTRLLVFPLRDSGRARPEEGRRARAAARSTLAGI